MPEIPAPSPTSADHSPAEIREEIASYDRRAEVVSHRGRHSRLTIRVLGEGPPLVLLPGVSSTYRGYAMTLNRLADSFRTILYEYPGDRDDDGAVLAKIGHDDLVDDLIGLVAALGHESASLFGLSFGSTLALRAAARRPDLFPRVVVQGAFARRPLGPAEALALRLGRRVRGLVSALPFHDRVLAWKSVGDFAGRGEDRWRLYIAENGRTPIASLTHRLDLIAGLDLRPALADFRARVLLIQGTTDRIVGRRAFEELRAALPDAEVKILEGIGHQPHFTHPELLAEIVREFLARETIDRPAEQARKEQTRGESDLAARDRRDR